MSRKKEELLELKELRISEGRKVFTLKKSDIIFKQKNDYFDIEIPKNIPFYFIPKDEAEVSEEYIQVIPTMTFVDTVWKKILVYQRNSEEKRLTDQWSFLFGGHIEPVDTEETLKGIEDLSLSYQNFRKILFLNLRRELMEEVGYFMYVKNTIYPMKPFYIDDNGGVSSKHLCFPFLAFCNFKTQKFAASKEIKNLLHMDLNVAFSKKFETWSQLVMNKFKEVIEWTL